MAGVSAAEPRTGFVRTSRSRRPDWSTGFARLGVAHCLGMAGEAALALALAGSLFFRVDPAEGRDRVLLGLLLTVAPFALVGPFIGPLVDRVKGGYRAVIVGAMAVRFGLAIVLVPAIASESVLLFPEAFAMLVLAKTYQVAKAAVVPTLVSGDQELVEANSKLQILGGLSGFASLVPAGLGLLLGAEFAVAWCALVFGAATVAAWFIPKRAVATAPAGSVEIAEVTSTPVIVDWVAMAALRGVVGFVTLLTAFALRSGPIVDPAEHLARAVGAELAEHPGISLRPLEGAWPQWYLGVVVALGILGGLLGASVAPRLRRVIAEERILLGSLLLTVSSGIWAVLTDGLLAFAGLAFGVAVAASIAKQAFDAVVQRDAPDANRGRLFARFEARFQIAWAIGALLPVVIEMGVTVGGSIVTVVASLATGAYLTNGFGQFSKSGKSGTSTSTSGRVS